MSNVISLNAATRRQQRVQEEACLWVVKMSAGLSDAELAQLHGWLDGNADHEEALLKVAHVWDETSVLAELARVFPLPEQRQPRRYRIAFRCFASALAAALMLGLYYPLVSWFDAAEPVPAGRTNLYTNAYETVVGQKITIVLPDGSVVILNTNSRIDVAFTGQFRDVTLQRGEGHFTVAKDKARPFRVHANGGMVEAVGTAFAVQQSPQHGLEVTVVEGIVSFTPTNPQRVAAAPLLTTTAGAATVAPAAPASPISLVAGEVVQFNGNDETLVKQKVEPEEIDNRLAWRGGMLLFEGDPLQQVIEEISRYTTIRIDVDDTIRDIEVLGYFRTGDVEAMLGTMQDTFGIKVERLSQDHIVLKADN